MSRPRLIFTTFAMNRPLCTSSGGKQSAVSGSAASGKPPAVSVVGLPPFPVSLEIFTLAIRADRSATPPDNKLDDLRESFWK